MQTQQDGDVAKQHGLTLFVSGIMASSSFSDAPNADSQESDAAKSVTIVINDNGEINYDEKTLQSIIGK